MTFVRPPIEAEPPDSTSLEGRASLGLKVLAILNGFGVVLAFFPPAVPVARLWTVSFNVASALLVVLFLVEARGLDRWRAWAVAIVRPLLLLIAVAGAYQFVVAILDGRTRIPFDVVIAVWALLGRPEADPPISDKLPTRRRLGLGLLGGAAAMSAVMLFSQPLFDWGGALDVRAADVHPTTSVDCGTRSADGIVPAVITIAFDWSWTAASPLPDGLDSIIVGWDGDDGLGRPLYLIGITPDAEHGVYSGRRGYPSISMTETVAAETRGSWSWGLELVERGHAPGHLTVELRRAQDTPPDPQPLTIKASYIHLGVWRHDAAPVTCSW
jgi:hypothetical protein